MKQSDEVNEEVREAIIQVYRGALDRAVTRLIMLREDPKIIIEFRKLLPACCVNTLSIERSKI